MLSLFADVFGVATRQERWSGPAHLRQPEGPKPSWQIERDLAEAKARDARTPGLF